MVAAADIEAQLKKALAAADTEAAKQYAVMIRDTEDPAVVAAAMETLKKSFTEKSVEARKGACMAAMHLSQVAGTKVEPYVVNMMPEILDLYSDKKMPVRGDAQAAAEAIVANVNGHALRAMLPIFFGAMAIEKKWQTKKAAMDLIASFVATSPQQVATCLPDLIPEVSHCMWDTKKDVKQAAKQCMKKICIGNQDITPFIPALIHTIANPEEVPECVHKLASTTFVKTVDAPSLAIMLPLLVRGLALNKTSIKRQTAVIIDNMCKLVEDPEEAKLFLPKLLPGLHKVVETAADPELREVASRAYKTLLLAGGREDDPDAEPYVVELSAIERQMEACMAKAGGADKVNPIVKDYVNRLCHDLAMNNIFDAEAWLQCITPFFNSFMKNADSLSNNLLEVCAKEINDNKVAEPELEEGHELCNAELSLAYGGMILLNNTKLRLLKGHRYGLCGPNGCGKSTLMRAIANGQLEGFPTKDELRTVFVEHNLQAEEADLNIVDFVMNDPELASIPRQEVVDTLTSVGFDDDLRAKAVGSLSGGWKMKLELARAMLMKADILLLDEPTNHLDVSNVQWLVDYLKEHTDITSMIVSHDSGFLDNVCTNIIHYENRKLKSYVGNLSKFVEVKPEAKSYYTLEDAVISFNFPEPGYLDNIKNKGKRILKLDTCSFTYPGQSKPTVTGISLACALSSRVGVVGPNGAGKSTIIKMLTGETEPTTGEVTKHPNMRFAYVAQHAFHHLEEHLDSTANEYIQWRFQNGSDKELLAKVSRQMTPEEKALMAKPVNWEGEKRVIEALRARRKQKKSFEYEVEWKNCSSDENAWVPREKLEKWGFEKLIQACDDDEAARANLMAKPVTSGVIAKHFQDFGLEPEFSTHNRIRGLSGGQKVKVVLGAAMWQNPHMIVLDEPTNYLDRDSLGALSKAIKDFGGGVVIISHNREFMNSICKEFWLVEAGRMKIEGEVSVDNDMTKIEQKLEETSIDAFGNKVKIKMKRKLTRKERKAKEKARKEAEARGEYWSDSDEDE